MEVTFLFSTTPAEIEHSESEDLIPTDGMILKEFDLENSNPSLLPLEERYDALFESYESIKKQMSSFYSIYRVIIGVKSNELKDTMSQDISALYIYYVLLKSPESVSSFLKQDWLCFFHWTNILSNQFYNRLQVNFPFLDWKAIRLCCLIRAGFTNRDMAIRLSVKEDSIHRMKNRLKVQFPGRFNALREFEEFIYSF